MEEREEREIRYSKKTNDSGSFGWAVLGFFIPIVGLILFIVWKDEKPRNAKMAGLGALVATILDIIVMLIFIPSIIALIATSMGQTPTPTLFIF